MSLLRIGTTLRRTIAVVSVCCVLWMVAAHPTDCDLKELCQVLAPEPPHIEERAPEMARTAAPGVGELTGGPPTRVHHLVANNLAAGAPVLGQPDLTARA
jgi:hypothetical protein